MRKVSTTLIVTAIAMLTATAQADALIDWLSPVGISSAADGVVNTNGTLIEARNLGGAVDRTVNTVLFQGETGRHGMGNNTDSSLYVDSGGSAALKRVMDSMSFSNTGTGGPLTFTLSGLTAGDDYLVQYFVSDDRNAASQNRGVTFEAGNTSNVIRLGSSQAVIGTFTADDTTQDISIRGWSSHLATGPSDTQSAFALNAFQVRDITSDPYTAPANLADVMILGDSITRETTNGLGTAYHVREAFANLANVQVSPANVFDVDSFTSNVATYLAGEDWDVVDFNVGLHDMKYGGGQYDTAASYATKLDGLIDDIQTLAPDATLIWRETTFVPNPESVNRHLAVGGAASDDAHQAYNTAAAAVVAAQGISLVDGTAAISEAIHAINGAGVDDVHYTTAGYRQLSRPVIENVYNALAAKGLIESGMRVDLTGAGETGQVQASYYDHQHSSDTLFVATDFGEQRSVDVTTNATGGRDRGADVSGAGSAMGDLLRDYIYRDAVSGPLEITLDRVVAGTYLFSGWFHDSDQLQGTADVDISVDGGATFLDAFTTTYSTGLSPVSVGTGSFVFDADGANEIVIRITSDAGDHLINGFEINQIPAPASVSVGAFMLGLIAMTRRRL